MLDSGTVAVKMKGNALVTGTKTFGTDDGVCLMGRFYHFGKHLACSLGRGIIITASQEI